MCLCNAKLYIHRKAAQHSTAQHSTAQKSTAQHSAAQHSAWKDEHSAQLSEQGSSAQPLTAKDSTAAAACCMWQDAKTSVGKVVGMAQVADQSVLQSTPCGGQLNSRKCTHLRLSS